MAVELLARLLQPKSWGGRTEDYATWRILGRLHGAPWPRATPDGGGGGDGDYWVDAIDQTAMQVGLPPGDPEAAINTTIRHTNFSINQTVIADFAELLATGRRARERSLLRPVAESRGRGKARAEVEEGACVYQFVF